MPGDSRPGLREEPLLDESQKRLRQSTSSPELGHSRDPFQLPAPAVLPAKASGGGADWGTVFTMCSATLGAGALSLPYAISQMGLLLGLGLLAATACATHYSISLLVGAMGATRLHSFEELNYGEICGDVGRCGEIWGDMHSFEELTG